MVASAGPPPPGYYKVMGDAVPDWSTEQMRGQEPSALGWTPVGPQPIQSEFWSGNTNASGRVVSIAVHPSNADIAYIAAASGGIWKTVDGGTNWTPLTDELPNLNHGCVALEPGNPDVVYAATGEYTVRSTGDGMFRSGDGGSTWTRVGTAGEVGSTCSRLIVDPSDTQVLHMTGARGYVRSIDGGNTWTAPLSGRASGMAMHPTDSDTLLVARHGGGIFRSIDGGENWGQLSGGLPTSGLARIILAEAKTAPGTFYAVFVSTGNGLLGLYRTTNSGDTWSLVPNTPNFPSPQGWYDVFFAVDPTDADILWAGGVFPTYAVAGVLRSGDAGVNWNDVTIAGGTQVHPDMQTVAFGPDGSVWVGCDGGVWKTTNAGQSWQNLNATLMITQSYHIDVDPVSPERIIAGTQDNGSINRTADVPGWPQFAAGDGGDLAFDFDQPQRRYFTYPGLSIRRREASGATVNINGPWGGDPKNFIAPMVMDPNSSSTLLGGTNRVWRTTNATASSPTWTAISTSAVSPGGELSALAVALGAPDTIYSGSDSGQVHVTTNGATWTNRTSGLPSSGPVGEILIDPDNPAKAYVGLARRTGSRLFWTDDYGATWQDRTGNLPSGISVGTIEADWRWSQEVIYLGTGAGVYWSTDGGTTWTKDGSDLPNVNVADLHIDLATNTIYAGTYGRSTWKATLLSITDVFDDDFESGSVDAWANTVP